MEITGRVTADAAVRETKTGKEVVGFSIAINDTFKSQGETKSITTYWECSYWLNSKVAKFLGKGTLVTLSGRAGVNPWMNKDNEPKASLTFNTDRIKFLGKSNSSGVERQDTAAEQKGDKYDDDKDEDDLPF